MCFIDVIVVFSHYGTHPLYFCSDLQLLCLCRFNPSLFVVVVLFWPFVLLGATQVVSILVDALCYHELSELIGACRIRKRM